MGEDFAGGCLCGEVRYRITAAPVEALYCHCRMCQRAHGAPVIAWLTVPFDVFAVTAGKPVAYRSSAKAFRHFCGSCGTPLTWREADNPRLVDISIASLDNPEAVAPTMHVWTDSRIPWFRNRRPPVAVSDERAAQTGLLTQHRSAEMAKWGTGRTCGTIRFSGGGRCSRFG